MPVGCSLFPKVEFNLIQQARKAGGNVLCVLSIINIILYLL